MKVLYHHRTQGKGSQWVHMMSVIRVLESFGFSVDIISPPGVDPRRETGDYVYKSESKKKSPVGTLWHLLSRHAPEFVFELAEIAYNFWMLPRLFWHARKNEIHLIYERHAYFLWAGAFLARRKRIPLIVEANDVSGYTRTRGQVLVRVVQWIDSYIFRAADTIVVVSSFLKESLIKRGVDPDKILVTPNGVDHQKFQPGAGGDKVRSTRGWNGKVIFGFVGWIAPYDNLPFLIDVFEEVHRLRPGTVLTVVGDVVGQGPTLSQLRAMVQDRKLDNAVFLTGPVAREQMPETISAMDVGIIPDSNLCGSPLVLFEFMATGKPVVAPDLGPLRDVIRHRENGFLFTPQNQNALKTELLRLIDRPEEREHVGTAARRTILEEHTWEEKVRKILAFHQRRIDAAVFLQKARKKGIVW